MTERKTIHLDGGKPLPIQEVFDGGGKIHYQDKPDRDEQPRKRITIRPPVEIVTDGDKCGKDCPQKFCITPRALECKINPQRTIDIENYEYVRCQACLDAEKAENEKDADSKYLLYTDMIAQLREKVKEFASINHEKDALIAELVGTIARIKTKSALYIASIDTKNAPIVFADIHIDCQQALAHAKEASE